MSKIFISAAREDARKANEIAEMYRVVNDVILLPWWEFYNIHSYAEQALEAISYCDTFHFIINDSKDSNIELGIALAHKKYICWDDGNALVETPYYKLLPNWS